MVQDSSALRSFTVCEEHSIRDRDTGLRERIAVERKTNREWKESRREYAQPTA
jgi:hypothetical protein